MLAVEKSEYVILAGKVDSTATLILGVTGGDGNYKFSLDPAVSGLSIDGNNRRVFTRPQAAAARTVKVTVTDGRGQSASLTIRIGEVLGKEVPITGDKSGVLLGGAVALGSLAALGGLGYWRRHKKCEV